MQLNQPHLLPNKCDQLSSTKDFPKLQTKSTSSHNMTHGHGTGAYPVLGPSDRELHPCFCGVCSSLVPDSCHKVSVFYPSTVQASRPSVCYAATTGTTSSRRADDVCRNPAPSPDSKAGKEALRAGLAALLRRYFFRPKFGVKRGREDEVGRGRSRTSAFPSRLMRTVSRRRVDSTLIH